MNTQEALEIMQLKKLEELDEKAIEKKYKLLALKLHPDKNKDDPNATEKFQKLSNARDFLINVLNEPAISDVNRAAAWTDFFPTEEIFKQEEITIETVLNSLKDLKLKIAINPDEIVNLKQILKDYRDLTGNQFDSYSEIVSSVMSKFRNELENISNLVTDAEDMYLMSQILTNRRVFSAANTEKYYKAWELPVELLERSAQMSYPLAVLEMIDIISAGWFYKPTIEIIIWAKDAYDALETYVNSNTNEDLLDMFKMYQRDLKFDGKNPEQLLSEAVSNRSRLEQNVGKLHTRMIDIALYIINFDEPNNLNLRT